MTTIPLDARIRQLVSEQAAQWWVANSEGPLPTKEAREFMRWLQESPVHVKEYMIIARLGVDLSEVVRESSTSITGLPAFERETVVELQGNRPRSRSAPALGSSTSARRVRSRHESSGRLRRSVIQATALILLTLVSVSMPVGSQRDMSWTYSQTFETRLGERRSVQLPDKTVIQLDSDSHLDVRFERCCRRATLSRGQAFFTMGEESKRPFSLRVGVSEIQDIGTSFNVRRSQSDTTISVVDGRVRIWMYPEHELQDQSMSRWTAAVALPGRYLAEIGASGQARVADSGTTTVLDRVNLQQVLAWRDGYIIFDNEPVASVVNTFNRYSKLQVTIEDAKLAVLPISGRFKTQGMTSFLAFLRSMPGVVIHEQGTQVRVSSKEPPTTLQ